MMMLLGLCLIILSLVWHQLLIWGNPGMSSYHLCQVYPIQLTLMGVVALVGALIGWWSGDAN